MKVKNRYEMDDIDRQVLALAREGVAEDDSGDNARDVMDESDMIDAMRLLVAIVDAGHAA